MHLILFFLQVLIISFNLVDVDVSIVFWNLIHVPIKISFKIQQSQQKNCLNRFFLLATFGILPPSSPNLFSSLVAFCVSLLLTFTSCSILQMCPHQRHQRGIFGQIRRSRHLRADFCPRQTWTRSEAYYQHIFTAYVSGVLTIFVHSCLFCVWLNCWCWENWGMVEGRFSKWF